MNKREFLTKASIGTLGLGAFALASPEANSVEPRMKDTAEIDYNLVVAVHYFSTKGIKTQIITDNLIVLFPKPSLYSSYTYTKDIQEVLELVKQFRNDYNEKMGFIVLPQEAFVTLDYDNKNVILTTQHAFPMGDGDFNNMIEVWEPYIKEWNWNLIYKYDSSFYFQAAPGVDGEYTIL